MDVKENRPIIYPLAFWVNTQRTLDVYSAPYTNNFAVVVDVVLAKPMYLAGFQVISVRVRKGTSGAATGNYEFLNSTCFTGSIARFAGGNAIEDKSLIQTLTAPGIDDTATSSYGVNLLNLEGYNMALNRYPDIPYKNFKITLTFEGLEILKQAANLVDGDTFYLRMESMLYLQTTQGKEVLEVNKLKI